MNEMMEAALNMVSALKDRGITAERVLSVLGDVLIPPGGILDDPELDEDDRVIFTVCQMIGTENALGVRTFSEDDLYAAMSEGPIVLVARSLLAEARAMRNGEATLASQLK
jgi:hypothetical protein